MQPIFGFALYAAVVTLVGVFAKKRGRSVLMPVLAMLFGGFGVVVLTGAVGGGGVAAGFFAFMVPLGVFFWLASGDKSEDLAVKTGAHGDFKKCRFCGESVRKEAIKCKHCGSDLSEPSVTS